MPSSVGRPERLVERALIAGRPQLSSMKLMIDDWSVRVWSTAFCFAHGETTSSGSRGP